MSHYKDAGQEACFNGLMWWFPDAELAYKANDLAHVRTMLTAEYGNDHPEFCTACALHPCDAIDANVQGFISGRVDQMVSDHFYEAVGGDDPAISLSAEHMTGLGKLILDYYRQHGKVKVWGLSKNVTTHPAISNII